MAIPSYVVQTILSKRDETFVIDQVTTNEIYVGFFHDDSKGLSEKNFFIIRLIEKDGQYQEQRVSGDFDLIWNDRVSYFSTKEIADVPPITEAKEVVIGRDYNKIIFSEPNSVTEVFTYKANNTVVRVDTISYSDSSKETMTSWETV
jgi:hypothetical protein